MSGRDLHLPRLRLRLVVARERSSSSSSSKSSSGRRGGAPPLPPRSALRPGNRWIWSSSESSTPSTHSSHSSTNNPSDHDWDSPGWQRRRLPRSRLAYSSSSPSPVEMELPSPYSSWTSPSSSEKRRAAAAAHAKNMERIISLNDQRYISLLRPPARHSPEDFDRMYRMGITEPEVGKTIFPAPDPFWSDEGYMGSDSDTVSLNTPRSTSSSSCCLMSPRFVKSEGASPTEPGFSLPFIDYGPASRGRRGTGKFNGRCLFQEDDDEDSI